jgi:hypothetical protein
MPIHEIITVESSDDDRSSDNEREFYWEPLRKNITEVEVVEEVDVPDALDAFLCPIDHSVMRDPVVCDDGHSYERCNIVRWLAKNTISPMTGKKLRHTYAIPNLTLQSSILEWLERLAEEKRSREDENAARVLETARVSESEELTTREDAAKHGIEADDSNKAQIAPVVSESEEIMAPSH